MSELLTFMHLGFRHITDLAALLDEARGDGAGS